LAIAGRLLSFKQIMQTKTTKILHIVPHLGGGVGKVLLSYLAETKKNSIFSHQVASLDYANENASLIIKNLGLKLSDKMSGKKEQLKKQIAKTDIVIIHWWNHPLLFDFLVREELPLCRLIMWSHISGFNPPAVFTKKLLEYPDKFVFVTPISFDTKEVKALSKKQKKELQVILATSNIEHIKSLKIKKHSGFNVGYIGTVDYAKLHKNFISMCSKINIPNVKFIICGGPNEKEMREQVERLGISDKFNFTGQIYDIKKYLSVFDIFGYPLSPNHYGACDQTLIESMAAGVAPVVLKNRMEKFMVPNGKVGIVAENETEYVRAIETLSKDKKIIASLSQNAKEHVAKIFSTEKMARDWENIFKETMIIPKTEKVWKINKKNPQISAADVFLESLGNYGKNFLLYKNTCNISKKRASIQNIKKMAKLPSWQSKTKATAHHYFSFFPQDFYLAQWSGLMTKNNTHK
jgi:glycosyltransferase involved in cell wall biosynthesis